MQAGPRTGGTELLPSTECETIGRIHGVPRDKPHAPPPIRYGATDGVGYPPQPKVPHKLDVHKTIINSRLEECPKLTALRLFEEVRAAGYTGGYSRLSEYVRLVRPREPVDHVVRYQTPAGRQGKMDFGDFGLPWGRRHAAGGPALLAPVVTVLLQEPDHKDFRGPRSGKCQPAARGDLRMRTEAISAGHGFRRVLCRSARLFDWSSCAGPSR